MTNNTLLKDLNRLYAAFVKLRRRALWQQTQIGGVYFVEIKRRRGGDDWNVHLHILAEGTWLSKSWLSSAWYDATKDSYIVDIRLCDSNERAAHYVAKYAGKGLHGSCYHDKHVLLEAVLALRGRRLVGKWGTFADLDLRTVFPPGTWERVCTLQVLLERDRGGDQEAREIVDALLHVHLSDGPARGSPEQFELPY